MKILFVGDDWLGSNARSLADGFRQAGHDVVVVDSSPVTLPRRLTPSWTFAKATSRRAPWTTERLHDEIDSIATSFRPDMLFCYKMIHLDQDRLLTVPAALRVHYSADDMSNPYNTTPEYLAHEDRWHAVVTTKRHNVDEMVARGVKQVVFVLSAFDPAWHHPCATRTSRRYLVGFIGARRPDRTALLHDLARTHGGDMYLAGPGWRRDAALVRGATTVAGPSYGESLSIAIAPVRANLVLLNSDNRDTHTCRTFEVPAAGGLFVGERTVEHGSLLDDGSEALLFDSRDELDAILARCATHPDDVDRIARRGHRRILDSGHRYVDRAQEIVANVR